MMMPHFVRNYDLSTIVSNGWAEPPLVYDDPLAKFPTISDGVVYFTVHSDEVAINTDSGTDIRDHEQVIFKRWKDGDPADRRQRVHCSRYVAEIYLD